MKKIVIALICLIILGIIGNELYEKKKEDEGQQLLFSTWKAFTPKSGLFQVLFPSAPQYAKDFLPISDSKEQKRFDLYTSEKIDGTLFLISVITYPPDYSISSSDEMLRQTINEFIHNKGENRSQKFWKNFPENPTLLDFSFENQDLKVTGRTIHNDHVVYMLAYITKDETFDEEELHYFIDSFKILKKSKEAVSKPL